MDIFILHKKGPGKITKNKTKTLNYQIHYSKDLAQVLPSEIFCTDAKIPWGLGGEEEEADKADSCQGEVFSYIVLGSFVLDNN